MELKSESPSRLSWKVREWAEEADISINYVYELAKSGRLRAVQIGSAWRILISPEDFYAQLIEEQNKVLNLDIN